MATAHTGIISASEADKLYSYPALSADSTTFLSGAGTFDHPHTEYRTSDQTFGPATGYTLKPGYGANALTQFTVDPYGHVKSCTIRRIGIGNNEATTSEHGLMSAADKVKLNAYPSVNNDAGSVLLGTGAWGAASELSVASADKLTTPRNIFGHSFDGTGACQVYAQCNTDADVGAKEFTLEHFSAVPGCFVALWNAHTNTASSITLSANGGTARSIKDLENRYVAADRWVQGLYFLTMTASYVWVVLSGPEGFTYPRLIDGAQFRGDDNCYHYAVCSTAAATAAKTCSLTNDRNFVVGNGAQAFVLFSNANTAANPTLSIGGTEALAMYNKSGATRLTGAALTAGMHHFVCSEKKYYDLTTA